MSARTCGGLIIRPGVDTHAALQYPHQALQCRPAAAEDDQVGPADQSTGCKSLCAAKAKAQAAHSDSAAYSDTQRLDAPLQPHRLRGKPAALPALRLSPGPEASTLGRRLMRAGHD